MNEPRDLISVDPGTQVSGVAQWLDGTLVRAESVRDKTWYEIVARVLSVRDWIFPVPFVVALEFPVIYDSWSKSKAPPADILKLAACAGAIDYGFQRLGGTVCRYEPDWKGQVRKEVTKNRSLEILTPAELAVKGLVAAKGYDIWDAIGLGLHHLGRHLPNEKWVP